MKKKRIIQYALTGLCILFYSCSWNAGKNSTKDNFNKDEGHKAGVGSSRMGITNFLMVKGNIKKGTMTIIAKSTGNPVAVSMIGRKFTYDTRSGFNIRWTYASSQYKNDDMYIEKIETHYIPHYSSDDHLSELLYTYQLIPSADFQGTIHIFLNFTSWYTCGLPSGSCDVRRSIVYGQKLADILKNNKPTSITHMGKNNTHPVGAQEPVVIDHTASPDSVRALMKAAKDQRVKDPRLLVIERTGSAGKVTITAFGKEEKRDAGQTYEWKFGEEQLKELRKFVVKQ